MFFLKGLSVLSLAFLANASLKISLSSPGSVESIGDIKVVASVTNTGTRPIRFLTYGTILDSKLPTRSFYIKKNGTDAAFSGIKLQLSLDDLDDTAFTTIAPGQTISAEHEVAPIFDFETLGVGSYTFEPVTHFQLFDIPSTAAATTANVTSVVPASIFNSTVFTPINIKITKDVARRSLPQKRASVQCSNTSRKSFITSAYSEGKSLASLASTYIGSSGSNTLFKLYFGNSSTSTVRSVFNAVANENQKSRTLNCVDSYNACSNGVIAYTVVATTNIHFCSIFFNEAAVNSLCSGVTVASRSVRAGTMLHEISHAVAGTIDVGYGCAYDQNLAKSNPSRAIKNADNYNCFATQIYASTRCRRR